MHNYIMDSLKLPPGFKFKPMDEELLTFYLKPKILGKVLPCNIVVEKEIYGPNSNPWDMFDFSNNSDNTVYVFTRLTKKAALVEGEESGGSCNGEEKRTQYVKKAGCGTWHGSTPRKKIMDMKKNVVIGTKRLLVFQINDVRGIDLNRVGYYRMHEYLLLGCEDYALCQITLDTSKNASVVDSCPKDALTSVGTTKPKATKKTSSKSCTAIPKAVPKSVSASMPKDASTSLRITKPKATKKTSNKAVPKSVSTRQPKASKKTVGDCCTAKLCSKTVSRSVSTTKPKDNKTTDTDPRTAMHERSEQVVLTESCRQESVALVSSVCPYGSDQGFVNKGLPQYGDGGSFRVEENVCQGFVLGDYDHGLTYEEAALFMMNNTKDSHECNDVIPSDLLGGKSWSEKDIEDLFEEVSCGNNVQQRENMNCNQALERSISFEAQVRCSDFSRDNVTLNIEDLFDDFWTEEYVDNFLNEVDGEEDIDNFLKEVLNDSDVQQQQPPMRNMSCSQGLGKSNVQQQQPPMQNMSCSQGLGKRKSFEAQECCSSGAKKLCSAGMIDSWRILKALMVDCVINGIGDVVLCTFLVYDIAGIAWATMASQECFLA